MPILTSPEWKALRKRHGVEKHTVKASVGSKLDDYHKAKSAAEKVKALVVVKKALATFKAAMDRRNNAAFIADIDKIIKEVDAKAIKFAGLVEQAKSIDTLTFKAIVADPKYKKLFEGFVKKIAADGEFEFYMLTKGNPKGKVAQKIYDLYVKNGASKQVNLDDSERRPLDDVATNGTWDAIDFKPAHDFIKTLLEQDTVPKFKNSLREELAKSSK